MSSIYFDLQSLFSPKGNWRLLREMILPQFKVSHRALVNMPISQCFLASLNPLASQTSLLVQLIRGKETDSEEISIFRMLWRASCQKPGQSLWGKAKRQNQVDQKDASSRAREREKQGHNGRERAKSQKLGRYWIWVWSNGGKQDSLGTPAFQTGRDQHGYQCSSNSYHRYLQKRHYSSSF